MQDFTHCDDYIDDEKQPKALRDFLAFKRSPAHGLFRNDPKPKLFADHNGRRVRVTMASRFGDVGVTGNLNADSGYTSRVFLSELSNFGDAP